MARHNNDIYGKYGVYGSLAYDFKPIGNENSGEYCKSTENVPSHKIRSRGVLSPAFAVACLLCVVLLAAGLLSRSSLVVLSEETSSLHEEIEELLDEQSRLKIRHEKAFPLAATEAYATEVLGMQKPASQQIVYIDILSEAEEVQSAESSQKAGLFSLIREYFPG